MGITMPIAFYSSQMKSSFILFTFIFLYRDLHSQSLCEWKTPELIYNKLSKTYHIEDDIKPYRIVWYRNDTVIKNSLSYRTPPVQIISVPNFRHFEVSPHILRNGDIYFLGDSFLNYSVFKVNFLNKSYDRQFNLSDYVKENKDFLDSIHYGAVGKSYGFRFNYDSSFETINCFVMDNDGMMYIDKVYIKNFIAFNPFTKTYKLLDSSTNPAHQLENHSEGNFLYIYHDKSLFKGKELPIPLNRFLKFSTPSFLIDSLNKLNALAPNGIWNAGLYRNRRYIHEQWHKVHLLNSTFDTIIKTINIPFIFSYSPSFIDGHGTIYMTQRIKNEIANEIHSDKIYTYNIHTESFIETLMPKDSLILTMVSSSVRIDCSGSLYAFGYLYRDDLDHRTSGRHTLNLYKQTASIDTSLNLSFDTTLKAIVYYYDADSVILDSKNPKFYLDTATCSQLSYRGKLYTSEGNYIDTSFNNYTGIDTFYYIKLSKNKTYRDTVRSNSCDSFTINNTTYKNSGHYTFPYKTIYGCDSMHILALTIHKSYFQGSKINSCKPYQWLDSLYTKTGKYQRKMKTVHQCDSIGELDLTIGLNNKVKLENGIHYTAHQDSVSYQWYRCNPWRRIVNETKKTFTTKTKGSYAVVLDNGKGCHDTSDCIELYSSALVTPAYSVVSPWLVYPNPFNEELTVELDRYYKEISVRIFDLTGRVILLESVENNSKLNINNSKLTKGIYYLQIETESQNQFFNIRKE
jgi:hypothetical protein